MYEDVLLFISRNPAQFVSPWTSYAFLPNGRSRVLMYPKWLLKCIIFKGSELKYFTPFLYSYDKKLVALSFF